MIGIAVSYFRGSGRSDLVRFGVVLLGAALGTTALLSASLVLAVDVEPDEGRYTSNLLNESGLRPGLASGVALMCVPVLAFIGTCARIGAVERDRRLAGLRLAGATPMQTRFMAMFDTTLAAALGGLAGLAAFMASKAFLAAQGPHRPPYVLPVDVGLAALPAIVVVLAVPALAAGSAALALRGVVITPLGLVRRHRRHQPSTWILLVLPVVVAASFGLVYLLAHRGSDFVLVALVAGFGSICVGLLLTATWITSRLAAAVAGRTREPSLLIAARRLETDPRGQVRATAVILLSVVLAAGAAVMRADTLSDVRHHGGDPTFYAGGYDLVELGLLLALVVGAAGVCVATFESVLDRRRSLATLTAAGVPETVLTRVVIAQAVLPLVPSVILAAVLGAGLALLTSVAPGGPPIPVGHLALIVVVAIGTTVLATALTLPLHRRTLQPARLRYE